MYGLTYMDLVTETSIFQIKLNAAITVMQGADEANVVASDTSGDRVCN